METVRYSYRLRPGSAATAFLNSEAENSRWLWNEAVNQQRTGKRPTLKKLGALLTEARQRASWLRSGSSVSQQQTLRTYDQALRNSFKVKGRGRPKFKKKHKTRPSIQYVATSFRLKEGVLHLPFKTTIPVVWSRPLPSPPTSVRVFQDAVGHWYASFVVRREITPQPAPDLDSAIGVDWGIATTATTTDPQHDLPYQGHRQRCAAELARSQRKLSRRRSPKGQPSSKGYVKAKLTNAKIHKKAARQAKHSAIQWARAVVDKHQLIAIEDFKPKFMFKSRLARKAADSAIGIIKSTLIEHATRAGREVVKVPPAYTTMTCSSCLARAKRRLELSERVFVCEFCQHRQDRDRNAADVVLAFAKAAQAGLNLASADGVRQRKAVGTAYCPTRQPELGISSLKEGEDSTLTNNQRNLEKKLTLAIIFIAH